MQKEQPLTFEGVTPFTPSSPLDMSWDFNKLTESYKTQYESVMNEALKARCSKCL